MLRQGVDTWVGGLYQFAEADTMQDQSHTQVRELISLLKFGVAVSLVPGLGAYTIERSHMLSRKQSRRQPRKEATEVIGWLEWLFDNYAEIMEYLVSLVVHYLMKIMSFTSHVDIYMPPQSLNRRYAPVIDVLHSNVSHGSLAR